MDVQPGLYLSLSELPKTGFVVTRLESVNKCKAGHMLGRNIAISLLKIIGENLNPKQSYDQTNVKVFVSSLFENYF